MWQYTPYLQHHGILGQKWGVRRYQDKNGHLTEAGRRHMIDDAHTIWKENKKEIRAAYKERKDAENKFWEIYNNDPDNHEARKQASDAHDVALKNYVDTVERIFANEFKSPPSEETAWLGKRIINGMANYDYEKRSKKGGK